MKMLLHLMAKDLRFNRVNFLFFWLCLTMVAMSSLLQRWFEPSWVIDGALVLCLFWSMGLMLALLLSSIHLDQPRVSNGFLQTRPISPVLRWLPKLLLWGLFALLPALIALLIQMASLKLDLRGEDYLRSGLKAALMMIGCFGTTAAIGAWVRHSLIAVTISLVVAFVLVGILALYGQPLTELHASLEYQPSMDLLQSRKLVALHFMGWAGFFYAAWVLASARRRSLILGLTVIAILCMAARFAWPMNLVRRSPSLAVTEPARLEELKSRTQVTVTGQMHRDTSPRGKGFEYLSEPIIIECPSDVPEWPRAVHYTNTTADASWGGAVGPWLERSAGHQMPVRRLDPAPMPERALLRLLKMPGNRDTSGSRIESAAAGPTLVLRYATPVELQPDVPIWTEGKLLCEWYRPVILAELPLRAGAMFTHDGKSIRLRSAMMFGGKLMLDLEVVRYGNSSGTPANDFDKAPDFSLSVINTVRGETASRKSTSTKTSGMDLGSTGVHAQAEYEIKDSANKTVKVGREWLDGARIYIVERRTIGRTEHLCRGELTVKMRKPLR